MKHKVLAAISCIAVLSGCASTTSEYYQAVESAAQANAAASQAKFDALSKIAASGDGQAASAAVMALALTQTPAITPIPQQSQALQWASILAAPISNLGMMWLQTDSTKTMAEYNRDVSLARVTATSADNQALYGAFVNANQITGDVAGAGFDAIGNVDYSPFIDGMVTLGVTGMDNLTDLGTAGFTANTNIATAGFDTAVTLGTAGITGAVDLGTAGITGVTDVATAGFGTMLTLDQGNNALLEGVWTDYTAAIAEIMANVPQVSCTSTVNADGSVSINCSP